MCGRVLYLDVTSSCKSPLNTGVQRVVRELYRGLAAVTAVTPVLWDPGLRTYCRLSGRERGFLKKPFGRPTDAGRAEPGRRANPIPVWSKLARRVLHGWHRFELIGAPGDTLFVPEIFQDNRLDWLAARGGGEPLRRVGVFHDAIAWRRPDITPPARQAEFLRYMEVLGSFERVICVSQEARADLEACWDARGCRAAPVTVAGWPVNHAGAARPPGTAPAAGARPSVLCVGTFEPRKNHLLLLAAAELLWARGLDFELVLIGRTTAQWGARVQTALAELQAARRPVRWLRHVDDKTLQAAYAGCTLTVFPSLVEGFGLPILESLWQGRPCVCGENGALGEAAAGGGCWPVGQTDAGALAAGLERVLTDPSLYARLCGEARDRRFDTWEAYIERLRLLF